MATVRQGAGAAGPFWARLLSRSIATCFDSRRGRRGPRAAAAQGGGLVRPIAISAVRLRHAFEYSASDWGHSGKGGAIRRR